MTEENEALMTLRQRAARLKEAIEGYRKNLGDVLTDMAHYEKRIQDDAAALAEVEQAIEILEGSK